MKLGELITKLINLTEEHGSDSEVILELGDSQGQLADVSYEDGYFILGAE